MRFLRRNPNDTVESAPEGAESAADGVAKGHSPGKGRPTPKRREAEARRRGPVPPPPRNQREAMRRARGNKDERRKASAERRERMMAGEDKYLLPRDRGQVKAYARDLVDSRRNLLGLFMPLAIAVFAALFLPVPIIQYYTTLACTLMLVVMIVEGVVLGRLVTRKVRLKFPDALDRAMTLGWYAFTRATQLRKLRVPRPRVTYGEVR